METPCKLCVRGHQTQLLLSTMHRKDAAILSKEVNGLLVQDFKGQAVIALTHFRHREYRLDEGKFLSQKPL